MADFPWDSAIIATIISVVISLTILVVRERKIEPQKWKKNIQFSDINQKLESHGALLTILQRCSERAQRQGVGGSGDKSHLLQFPNDSDSIRDIFEKSRFLLSKELIDEYLQLVRKDEYFQDSTSSAGKPSEVFCALSEMQRIAQKEFDSLKSKREKMTT